MSGGPASVGASAHVLVASVDAPELRPTDRHHLERVLRLRAGTVITVGNGAGSWCRVGLGAKLELLGDVQHDPADPNPITIGIALTKADKPELAVQKLTELGIDRILMFPSARSVVRWEPERIEAHMERLRRVAESAACQCRRSWLPDLLFASSFSVATDLPSVALAAADGEQYDPIRHSTILVGPEGGWSPEELQVSLPRVALGPHILRAETAAIAAGAVASNARYFRL